jgi:hypothetical protein
MHTSALHIALTHFHICHAHFLAHGGVVGAILHPIIMVLVLVMLSPVQAIIAAMLD